MRVAACVGAVFYRRTSIIDEDADEAIHGNWPAMCETKRYGSGPNGICYRQSETVYQENIRIVVVDYRCLAVPPKWTAHTATLHTCCSSATAHLLLAGCLQLEVMHAASFDFQDLACDGSRLPRPRRSRKNNALKWQESRQLLRTIVHNCL